MTHSALRWRHGSLVVRADIVPRHGNTGKEVKKRVSYVGGTSPPLTVFREFK
jgi:hypothetical protein